MTCDVHCRPYPALAADQLEKLATRQSHPTHSPTTTTMIPENGITLDTILEGILVEGDEVEEAVRTMRSDLLRAAMPILAMPSALNVKAEQPDSCSDSMVCQKYILQDKRISSPKSCSLQYLVFHIGLKSPICCRKGRTNICFKNLLALPGALYV